MSNEQAQPADAVGSSAQLGLGPERYEYADDEAQDRLLEMAMAAGFKYDGQSLWSATLYGHELLRFMADVQAAERERSAELCEQVADRYAGKSGPQSIVAQLCATVVRGA